MDTVDKKSLTERDICTKSLLPHWFRPAGISIRRSERKLISPKAGFWSKEWL